MRILLWHGYLLGGTGSNVYTRSLAREWSRAGHDVIVFAQEPQPRALRPRRSRGRAARHRRTAADLRARPTTRACEVRLLPDLTAAERERYVTANATALREHTARRSRLREPRRARRPVAAATGARYAVKAHGSELEYSMRGNAELSAWGRESLAGAEAVFVGSEHIRRRARRGRRPRRPRARRAARRRRRRVRPAAPRRGAPRDLLEESRADPPNPGNANERLPDEGNAERLEAFLAEDEPTVLYFGKLLRNKGVHVLFEALARGRRARRRRRLRRLPRGARAHGADRARSSRARSSTGTSRS